MSKKIFRNILIVCVAAFLMAAVSIGLCANYLLSYKPSTDGDKSNTYVYTDEYGNRQVIQANQLEGSYNFLVMGHDRAALLTDVIMLINYNINTSSVTLMQFPRDTYVSYDVPTHKINATFSTYYNQALSEGKDQETARLSALESVADMFEESLGITIYKSAVMNLDGFSGIVDALGGVEVNVPSDLYYSDPAQGLYINLRAGYQTLNGEQAEQFVRYRAGYLQADLGRENAQKIFMSAFIQKAKNSINISNVGTLTNIATEIINNLTTNITVSDMVYFAKSFLGGVSLSNINMMTVPGSALSNEYGGSYYVINRNALLDIVSANYNTTDISDSIFKQNFDKNIYFTDLNSNAFTNAYYSTEIPQISESFNAQSVIDDSIEIPKY